MILKARKLGIKKDEIDSHFDDQGTEIQGLRSLCYSYLQAEAEADLNANRETACAKGGREFRQYINEE
ncbi:uncharacterized protein Z518_04400 [Rhinocladiella mackenziei CBS 650.93]|uniref:Uncharacterized protein n=1 Tax=Rhinocladiella mackenziei CBS 650.93 TaxID=1442369 RepID=A0A0D2IL45_9EURO|nr:uncharacterized protein Z518_04400 [Rhinocladiella mackenziei CBS 650.93]KIX06424.1 hypothetical protein Z518_04400 [Rhinocladiella mackenziei CBS 650.93]